MTANKRKRKFTRKFIALIVYTRKESPISMNKVSILEGNELDLKKGINKNLTPNSHLMMKDSMFSSKSGNGARKKEMKYKLASKNLYLLAT